MYLIYYRNDVPIFESFFAGQTPSYKHLYGGVIFVDKLPKNANGKVLKQELKALYYKQNSHQMQSNWKLTFRDLVYLS